MGQVSMSGTITVVCCDCENRYWDEDVSDRLAETYADEIEFQYDEEAGESYPTPDSFSRWAANYNFPRDSCPECGSDGAFSWSDKD